MANKFLILSFFTIVFSSVFASAQVRSQNYDGTYNKTKTLDGAYIGSIYFMDKWKMAYIKLANGEVKNVKVIYNLLDDLFYVEDSEGKPVPFDQPYNEVSLMDDIGNMLLFKRFTNAAGNSAFFQVLFYDKIQLFKKTRANFIEFLDYNEVSAKKKVTKQSQFYAQFKNREMSELKISKKNILNLMVDKKTEMDSFFDQDNVDLKSDSDLVKLFTYYNSLL